MKFIWNFNKILTDKKSLHFFQFIFIILSSNSWKNQSLVYGSVAKLVVVMLPYEINLANESHLTWIMIGSNNFRNSSTVIFAVSEKCDSRIKIDCRLEFVAEEEDKPSDFFGFEIIGFLDIIVYRVEITYLL